MSALERDQVFQAVQSLRKLEDNKEKKTLLENDGIYITLNLHKLPKMQNNKSVLVKLPLPHSTLKGDACLIVGDSDGRKDRDSISNTVHMYEEKVRKAGISQIREVITLLQLKLEYSSFESKRALATRFDSFIADAKVMRFLPDVLGKAFYGTKSKRFPIQVDLSKDNIEKELKKALSTNICAVNAKGCCSSLLVGRLSLTDDEIVTNILTGFQLLSEKVPGGLENIRSLYLKLWWSPALPIYCSYVDLSKVRTPKVTNDRKSEDEMPLESVSTIKGQVSVSRDGTITILKANGEVSQVIGGTEDKVELKRKAQRVEAARQKATGETAAKKLKTDTVEKSTKSNKKQKAKGTSKKPMDELHMNGVTSSRGKISSRKKKNGIRVAAGEEVKMTALNLDDEDELTQAKTPKSSIKKGSVFKTPKSAKKFEKKSPKNKTEDAGEVSSSKSPVLNKEKVLNSNKKKALKKEAQPDLKSPHVLPKETKADDSSECLVSSKKSNPAKTPKSKKTGPNQKTLRSMKKSDDANEVNSQLKKPSSVSKKSPKGPRTRSKAKGVMKAGM